MSADEVIGCHSLPALIIDDHILFSKSLEVVLRGNGLDAHCIPVTDHATILAEADRFPAAVALLDLTLGPGTAAEPPDSVRLTSELVRRGKLVLIVTGSDDVEKIAAAIVAGAHGVLFKTSAFIETVVDAVRRMCSGEWAMTSAERDYWVTRYEERDHARESLERRIKLLSARESEVLYLMVQGHRAKVIAEKLFVSITTVRTHIHAILLKLEVKSQLEAITLANSSLSLVELNRKLAARVPWLAPLPQPVAECHPSTAGVSLT
jgi:DNA-binding NarL/FixJ family response regulator